LPFFAWKTGSWSKRIQYIILFSFPMILSLMPILAMSPDAFYSYMYEQTVDWPAKKSFAFIFETISGSTSIFGLGISTIMNVLFLGLILVMFIVWHLKKFDVDFWFKFIIVIFVVYYGLLITASLKFYESDLTLGNTAVVMAAFAAVYFIIAAFVLRKFLQSFKLKTEPREEIFVLSAFAIIFILFSSPQFNPWYILWLLPFTLAVNNNYIRFILLWLMFWNFEGMGISLLPGLALA
ncbi:MAG: hypothetical protein JSV49_08700, partial [Thermoplasmata archaeon]